ncbi:uncharacterized protein LOC134243425 isoform X2 [Saccostrea cucullata]|uniref:uncharacterized protein LOC134243425 isoform X2 n=1 Tax=Saccostrea cuccullata TaxID=36930 RepID=UPI002ED0C9EA
MASFLVLFYLCLSLVDAAQNFQEVSDCPRNADTWKIESDKKNCQEYTPDYLCAAIENNVGKFGEICTKYGLSPGRKCAVLNNQTHNLDSVDCKAAAGCPRNPYYPSELWKYPICYADFYGTTRAPHTTTTVQTTAPQVSGPKDDDGGLGEVVFAVLISVAIVVSVVFYCRNMFGFKDKMHQLFDDIRNHLLGNREGETRPSGRTDLEAGVSDDTGKPLLSGNEAPVNGSEKQKQDKAMYATVNKDRSREKDTRKDKKDVTAGDSNEQNEWNEEEMKMKIKKLNILQEYLVHILRREIDVKDLKEKSIIHSKSLGEHFTEPVLQDLYGVEKSDDYNKLDMSLVFALLRNFCVNFKPPTKGWDYEPPEDERTVGADIERIRSMWNKYCDNDYDFKNLDDVFNRMRNKYGTVAVQNDIESQNKAQDALGGFSEIKEKIHSIKLNPDCYVEKGIVVTGGIKSAIQLLETGNVVIFKGAIGCGKTHALKAIKNKYTEKRWKVRWMEENLLPLEENMEDKTILICDNLFGSFGCNIFSSSRLLSFENLLECMREKSRNTKVAVGIHQHVFDEIKKNHNLKLLQNKNITVDLDKLTKSELLLIMREQQNDGHCKTDPNCWFKTVDTTNVLDKLRENQGHIGSPFLSLMYCHHHDLFSDVAFTKAPLQTLTQRFLKMKSDSAIDYYILVYLMCVRKKHEYGNELAEWAISINAFVSKEYLQKTASNFPGFIRFENGSVTLRHEVLNIALLKATSHVDADFLPVVQKCELEFLLQLMRPAGSGNTEFSCCFPYPEKGNTKYRKIGKFLVKRFADSFKTNWESMEHPLKKHEFFVEKYTRYLTSNPKEK